MKRAVWLPNWIGDAIMATPALQLLREAFPQDELVGIYRPPVDEALAGTRLLDKMILDRSRGKGKWREKWNFIRQLRREGIQEILLFPNSSRTASITRLTGIPRRIGFSRDGRGWLLTDRLKPHDRRIPNPALEEFLRLAGHVTKQADLSRVNRQLLLSTTREDQLHWDDFATRHCLDAGHYICFNSGGAFGAAKHWPVESFAELARKIVQATGLPVVMLCGPAERELARRFEELTAHPQIHSLSEEALSVGLSKVVVKHSRLMITTDSGPRHFAAAFGVPVMTLFGPTHIAWSETFFDQAVHLQLALDCGPCQQRTCPLGHHRCMQDLTVERVYAAFWELYRRQAATSAA